MILDCNVPAVRSISQFPVIRKSILHPVTTVPITRQQPNRRRHRRNSLRHNINRQDNSLPHLTQEQRHIHRHQRTTTHRNHPTPISLRRLSIPTPTSLTITRPIRRTCFIIHKTHTKARSKTLTMSYTMPTIQVKQQHQASNINHILTIKVSSHHV